MWTSGYSKASGGAFSYIHKSSLPGSEMRGKQIYFIILGKYEPIAL